MDDLKNTLLELIQKGKQGEYDLKKLAVKLNMTKTSDFVMLNKALNELEDSFFITRNQKNFFVTCDQAGLLQGKISINRRGFGFLDLEDDMSVFINQDNLNGAMDKDTVLVKLHSDDKNGEGEVVKILQHNTNYVVGTFVVTKAAVKVQFDDERIANQRTKINNLKDFKVVTGLKARFKILNYAKPLILEIDQIIGHKDDPGVDISSVLMEYDILTEFPKEALEQANQVSEFVTPEQKAGRKDLTNKIVVTIDGDDSKDFDDAISIEKYKDGYKLYVHIADVSYYVTKGSPLDEEAYVRGTSTYVADRVVPMLPHILSNGICSLNPHVERLTLTCEMDVNAQGNVRNYEIYPSFIKSTERMTYNNVNKILAGDSTLSRKYEHLGNIFEMMKDCAATIRKRRYDNGAIDFDKEEAKVVVDTLGKVVDIKVRERGESERIIEDFMIAANEVVARHMKYQEVPTLYRIHEQPLPKKLKNFTRMALIMGYTFKGNLMDVHPKDIQNCLNHFKGTPEETVISTLMLRCMQKAKYDPHCIGHFGLGSEEYLHFTSPIRRYPDLIVHRMLRKYCFNSCIDVKQIKNDEELMDDYAQQTSERERASTEAEREVEDMKKAEFMQSRIGVVYPGVISSVTKFGFYVELENTIEGLVHVQTLTDDYYHFDEYTCSLIGEHTGKQYKLGQEVEIKVTDASKEERTISFALNKAKKKKKQKWI